MKHDAAAADRLSQAVREIETLLHPTSVPRTAPLSPAPPSPPANKIGFCEIAVGVAIVNFLAFLVGAAALGGDALSGRVEGGRYYVSSHGQRTEVSKTAFYYSRIHGFTLFFTHPVGAICAMLRRASRKSRRQKQALSPARSALSS